MNHTAGPWIAGKTRGLLFAVFASDQRRKDPICVFGSGVDEDRRDFKQAAGNARLIAHTPLLYEALHRLSAECEASNRTDTPAMRNARTVLAMLKG